MAHDGTTLRESPKSGRREAPILPLSVRGGCGEASVSATKLAITSTLLTGRHLSMLQPM